MPKRPALSVIFVARARWSPRPNCSAKLASCENCGSSPRARAIIRVLSLGLFGQNLLLPDFPVSREVSGLGMSDWDGYAVRLAEKFRYTNTYFHQEPRLDISGPQLAECLLQSSDFIISSEVFEHVVPPVRRAFENTFKMLKPGGILVLTVPYGHLGENGRTLP